MQIDFLISRPKIAILGLNPHAGDNGLIGNQDEKVIKPVIDELNKENNFIFLNYSVKFVSSFYFIFKMSK